MDSIVEPNGAEAYYNVGNTLLRQGSVDEAVHCYREAIRLNPLIAEAYNNLGTVLKGQGKLADAIQCFRQALRLKPGCPEAHTNLGSALREKGNMEGAVSCYRQALVLDAGYVQAHYNLSNVLMDQRKLDEAIISYQHALELQPNCAEAHNNLGNALLKQGLPDLARQSFQNALSIQPNLAAAQSNALFCLNYDPAADPHAVFAEHARWGKLLEPAVHPLTCANDPDPDRRLRIGYVSPDLRLHAVTRCFEPVLANHDPVQVEVFCYAESSKPDAVTTRLQKRAHGWRRTCRVADAQVAEWIHGDRIDILVDLAGHSANTRLPIFAYKPAPIQLTWLGYLNTTGLTRIDYRLTDVVMDPPGEPRLDTEELIRLPSGMCCFGPLADAPTVSPLPALRRGHLTFGSVHNLFKLNTAVFDFWSCVLKALPTSRLLVLRDSLTSAAKERILRQFTERGIAAYRLDLRQPADPSGYLEVFNEIDILLDAFPHTGGVTTCEALWMGVPEVTLCGVRPASRYSASILSRAGLSDWVAQTPQQYVDLAVRKASDLQELAVLRAGLRDRMTTTLCDGERFTRVLEDTYRTMWRRWCAQHA